MAKNFTNLVKDINLQIQEAEQTTNRINSPKSIPKYITVTDKRKTFESS